jgi:hypothetical protein
MDDELSLIAELLGILVERLEMLNAELRLVNEQLEEFHKLRGADARVVLDAQQCAACTPPAV